MPILQHLVLHTRTMSRTNHRSISYQSRSIWHRSRSILCHGANLDLVQTFHHLDRSRGTILYRSCSSTILQHFYRQVAEQASAVIAAARATAAASVGSLAGAAVACGDGCKLCFLAPRNMKLKTTPCVLAYMYQHTLAVVGAPQPMGPQPWGNCKYGGRCTPLADFGLARPR